MLASLAPSMRSSPIVLPPPSTITTLMATPMALAPSIAWSMRKLASAWVSVQIWRGIGCALFYLIMPARRRLRCHSRATPSSACLAVFWPSKASDTPVRNDNSSPSHAGFAEIGMPVSIADAAAAGQPNFATIAGLRNDDARGGALPPSMERSIASLLQAMRRNSVAQSGFLEYFEIAMNWPSTMLRLWSFEVIPGTVANAHRPAVFDTFGSLNSVP